MIQPESSSVNQAGAIRDIRGSRYVAYARSAARDGAETSLERQLSAIHHFAEGQSMRCVGEIRLVGVSGGPPALRADLLALLTRKRERNDYEVLVMENFARLVRAQSPQDLAIGDEFAKCGVLIVFVQDHEPTAQEGTAP
ncbi:MAG: recombinase family protein [Pirellulales bacterium]